MAITLEHLTNSHHHLRGELQTAFKTAVRVAIATAFISDDAAQMLEDALRTNKKLKSVRLLTGLYQSFNQKKDLARLLALVQKYPAVVEVHLSLNLLFHWKYYHFTSVAREIIYTGSANFTAAGLEKNGEIMVKLSTAVSTKKVLSNLAAAFDKEWENSRPLAEFPLSKYKERPRAKMAPIPSDPAVKAFFKKKRQATVAMLKQAPSSSFTVQLISDASALTYTIVEKQKSEWDRRGWGWFVLTTNQAFQQAIKQPVIFVFSREGRGKMLCWYARVMDSDGTLKTPDGKYFIAYKILKGRLLTRRQMELLRKEPVQIDLIGYKNALETKVLSKTKVNYIMKLLRL